MRDRLPANPYRYGLLVIAIAQLGVTLQALFAPKRFYGGFPVGRGWVEAYPAYNEHLIYDYGAYTLGALLALALAAMWLDRRVVQLAIISWLAGASIHFVYHAVTLDRFGTVDAVANMTGLLLYLVLPGWLLVRSRHESPAEDSGRAGARAAT